MADEIHGSETTHQSELERLTDQVGQELHNLAYIINGSGNSTLAGAINWRQMQANIVRSIDAIANHVNPPVAQFVRETPSPQLRAAMAQAKKSLEDQMLYTSGKGGSAVVDFNDYNYFQRVPTAEEVFGTAPPPYDNGGDPGPTPEEEAAEAKKVADYIRDQPSWVPREIGETRHLKFDTIAIRIMRLVGAGATGTYRIEVDGPKNGWGKSAVSVNGRTCSYYPYWACERGLMLEILMLLEKMARALYPDA